MIGAGIYATDLLIGVVEKVVINPDNRLVTAILANAVFPDPTQMGSNWLWNEHLYAERRIIIPIETVRHQSESRHIPQSERRRSGSLRDIRYELILFT